MQPIPVSMPTPEPESPSILDDLGLLYHNYKLFGVENRQIPQYVNNQKVKEPILTGYIAQAIAKSRKNFLDKISLTEMFCADGYFAMLSSKLGCDHVTAIDSDQQGYLSTGRQIAERLKIDNVEFVRAHIHEDATFEQADIVANIGGLYHTDTPEEIFLLSLRMAKRYLVVQNVVSMANNDPTYFESPAPGWSWGSRYSVSSFDAMIRRYSPKIIDYHHNVLVGNPRMEDRGSVYYLIEK